MNYLAKSRNAENPRSFHRPRITDLTIDALCAMPFVIQQYNLVSLSHATLDEIIRKLEKTFGMNIETDGKEDDKLQKINQMQHYHATNVCTTYDRTFRTMHHLKVMGGYNWETKSYKGVTARGFYLMSQKLNDLDLVGSDEFGEKRMEVEGGQNEYALMGFFGRINYDFAGKYLFEMNGHYDGTSRFAANHRWGSVSVGLSWMEDLGRKILFPAQEHMQQLKIPVFLRLFGESTSRIL